MLTSVYFDVNKSDLKAETVSKLDSLAQLKANLTFRIYGNCDSSGTDEFNRILSEKRAEKVTAYLSSRISPNIKIGNTVGLGETKPVNDNSTHQLKAKNRRVDIFIERSFLPGEKISRKGLPSFFDTRVSDMKAGDTLSLPDVNFYGGRHVWLPKAELKLKRLLNILKYNPELYVELQGHICCDYENFDGEDLDLGTFNLSVTRAEAIRNYLLKNGINADRIKAAGLGHLNPVVYPETTERDRTLNRRVELLILKN